MAEPQAAKSAAGSPQTVGIEELCRILAGEGQPPITKARVSQLVKEGMPVAGRNKYEAVRCMFWYIGKLRRSVKSRQTENQDGSQTSVEDERKRLLRIQADREELELEARRDQLVDVHLVEQRLADIMGNFKARIGAVPSRVAPRILGETNRLLVQGQISKELNEAMTALGNGDALKPRSH